MTSMYGAVCTMMNITVIQTATIIITKTVRTEHTGLRCNAMEDKVDMIHGMLTSAPEKTMF